ncbi:MAG: TetR family transcriptional regulator [Thermocaproicibacter melissae]|jgi:TetR/AcrR family transcriptional regulator, fatty acid metabolism regulator protein|uniref:TetR/AcrR family transcriptional regulator n=1 Tax=Thermocaproicibacter melissae TaxID=2966552 RepID=UPI003A101F74
MGKDVTSRTLQAMATKKRIYECGISLMKKYGYENITIEQIAKKAKVSVGTYYHYFQSKFDLFVEIYRQGDKYFKDKIPALRNRTKNCKERISEYFALYAQLALKDGLAMVRNLYVPTNKMFLTHGRAMQDLLMDILREGQKNGELPPEADVCKITETLFVAARGVIFDWSLHDGSNDLVADMRNMIDRLASTYLL